MIMSSEEIVNEISNVASEINRFIIDNVSGAPNESISFIITLYSKWR